MKKATVTVPRSQVPFLDFSDERLMEAAAQGEEAAFTVLYNRHHLQVLRFIHKQINDLELAEDVTEEIFVQVYKHRNNFRVNSSFLTWLNAITGNKVKNVYRSRTYMRNVYTFSAIEQRMRGKSPTLEIADQSRDALDQLIDRELGDAIEETCKALPEFHRNTLELIFVNDRSYKEASNEMRVRPGTIKSRVYRARQAFRQQLPPKHL